MHTPSFVVWALERHCPLRQIAGWEDPERTERLLRAARAYDEARAEGRILDGIALGAGACKRTDPADAPAFRVDTALAVYGGTDALHAACRDCPANALAGHHGRLVAGCFGMWPLPNDLDGFVADASRQVGATGSVVAAIPATVTVRPAWYGLWLESPLASAAAEALAAVVRQLEVRDADSAAGRDELALALDASARRGIPLHVRLYPPGRVRGPWWELVEHCGRCRAPWLGRGPCRVCGQSLHPASHKRRHIRGSRPFVELARLMSRERAAELLHRFRHARQL
jgi:hypothetical protein